MENNVINELNINLDNINLDIEEEINNKKLSEITKTSTITIEDFCPFCNGTGRSANSSKKCEKCGKIYEPNISNNIFIQVLYDKELNYNIESFKEEIKNLNIQKNDYLLFEETIKTYFNLLNVTKYENRFFYLSDEVYSKVLKLFKSISFKLNINNIKTSDLLDINDVKHFDEQLENFELLILILSKYNLKDSLNKLGYIIDKRILMEKPTVIITKIPRSIIEIEMNKENIYIERKIETSLIVKKL